MPRYLRLGSQPQVSGGYRPRKLRLGRSYNEPLEGSAPHLRGELYKYAKIVFDPRGRNYADAAIALIMLPEYLVGEVLGGDDQSTYTISGTTDDVRVEDAVRKSGRTTGVTVSIVLDTNATVKVWYTQFKWAVFYDQVLVYQPFIESGDSGSPVDKDGAFVGLAFAGSSSVAVVCKAKYVVSLLGIQV